MAVSHVEIANRFEDLRAVKAEIKDAILDRGGTVSLSDTFYDFGKRIREIPGGVEDPLDWVILGQANLIGYGPKDIVPPVPVPGGVEDDLNLGWPIIEWPPYDRDTGWDLIKGDESWRDPFLWISSDFVWFSIIKRLMMVTHHKDVGPFNSFTATNTTIKQFADQIQVFLEGGSKEISVVPYGPTEDPTIAEYLDLTFNVGSDIGIPVSSAKTLTDYMDNVVSRYVMVDDVHGRLRQALIRKETRPALYTEEDPRPFELDENEKKIYTYRAPVAAEELRVILEESEKSIGEKALPVHQEYIWEAPTVVFTVGQDDGAPWKSGKFESTATNPLFNWDSVIGENKALNNTKDSSGFTLWSKNEDRAWQVGDMDEPMEVATEYARISNDSGNPDYYGVIVPERLDPTLREYVEKLFNVGEDDRLPWTSGTFETVSYEKPLDITEMIGALSVLTTEKKVAEPEKVTEENPTGWKNFYEWTDLTPTGPILASIIGSGEAYDPGEQEIPESPVDLTLRSYEAAVWDPGADDGKVWTSGNLFAPERIQAPFPDDLIGELIFHNQEKKGLEVESEGLEWDFFMKVMIMISNISNSDHPDWTPPASKPQDQVDPTVPSYTEKDHETDRDVFLEWKQACHDMKEYWVKNPPEDGE
jgi:hypothetical protein